MYNIANLPKSSEITLISPLFHKQIDLNFIQINGLYDFSTEFNFMY